MQLVKYPCILSTDTPNEVYVSYHSRDHFPCQGFLWKHPSQSQSKYKQLASGKAWIRETSQGSDQSREEGFHNNQVCDIFG